VARSDPGQYAAEARKHGRNSEWKYLNNADILSMPDNGNIRGMHLDLAFHCIPFALIDADFAKHSWCSSPANGTCGRTADPGL